MRKYEGYKCRDSHRFDSPKTTSELSDCHQLILYWIIIDETTVRQIIKETIKHRRKQIKVQCMSMGSTTGGPEGHAPPPDFTWGISNAFRPPPPILGKILLCTQLMSCFSLKKTMECIHNSVHFIKIF